MDKLPKKPMFKPPTIDPVSGTVIQQKNIMGTISKWVPLICAGSAIGISMFALKEIKNTRKELINLKKEQYTAPNNDKLEKKMELLEKQLTKITEYLKTSQAQQARVPPYTPPPPPPQVSPKPVMEPSPPSNKVEQKNKNIVKNAVNVPTEVKIINETSKSEPEDDEDVEYEEIEVTDDES